MKTFALSDVQPAAITLVKQGANRKRIFLKKSVAEADLLTLPAGPMPILKAAGDDWTAVYCVVAEPGAEEDPGLVGDRDSVDVWASAEEIRKAAHHLLKAGAYVNLAHDGEPAEGCAIVESAVALADLPVGDETIREGSWYVAIEPAAELRKSIEDGDIDAISLEGTGLRTEIQKAVGSAGPKAKKCPSCGGTVKADKATCQNCGHTFAVKKASTFGEQIGAQELRDSMWRATSTLESVIYQALSDDDESDPKAIIRASLDQFVTYLAGKLDALPEESRAVVAKQLGSLAITTTEEESMGLAEDFAELKKTTGEQFEGLKKSNDATTAAVEGLVGLTGKLVDRVEALSAGGGKTDGDGTGKESVKKSSLEDVVERVGTLADKMDSFDSDLTGIAKSVREIAAGDSSQTGGDDREAVRKNKDPLAGLLA